MSANIGKEFIEKTKYKYLSASPQQQGVAPPKLQADLSKNGERVDLPEPLNNEFKALADLRQSVRDFSNELLSQEELSYLLWCTQGVKQVESGMHTFRTVPSAGARHELETFVMVNRVEGLEPYLYQYLAIDNKLAIVSKDERMAGKISLACLGQQVVAASAVTLIWVAAIDRIAWRYGERSYRYIFLDAGHVCQNLYMAAEAIGCGCCAIGAFDDDVLNETLGLNGKNYFAIYGGSVGKKC